MAAFPILLGRLRATNTQRPLAGPAAKPPAAPAAEASRPLRRRRYAKGPCGETGISPPIPPPPPPTKSQSPLVPAKTDKDNQITRLGLTSEPNLSRDRLIATRPSSCAALQGHGGLAAIPSLTEAQHAPPSSNCRTQVRRQAKWKTQIGGRSTTTKAGGIELFLAAQQDPTDQGSLALPSRSRRTIILTQGARPKPAATAHGSCQITGARAHQRPRSLTVL